MNIIFQQEHTKHYAGIRTQYYEDPTVATVKRKLNWEK